MGKNGMKIARKTPFGVIFGLILQVLNGFHTILKGSDGLISGRFIGLPVVALIGDTGD